MNDLKQLSPPRAPVTTSLLGRGVRGDEGKHRASVLDGQTEPKSGGRGGDPFPFSIAGTQTGRFYTGKMSAFNYAEAERLFMAAIANDPGVPCSCGGLFKPWADGLYRCNNCDKTAQAHCCIKEGDRHRPSLIGFTPLP